MAKPKRRRAGTQTKRRRRRPPNPTRRKKKVKKKKTQRNKTWLLSDTLYQNQMKVGCILKKKLMWKITIEIQKEKFAPLTCP